MRYWTCVCCGNSITQPPFMVLTYAEVVNAHHRWSMQQPEVQRCRVPNLPLTWLEKSPENSFDKTGQI